MLVALVRRLLQSVAAVAAMSVLVFLAVFAIGNPVDILVPPEASGIAREAAIAQLGLDRPLVEQYAAFVGDSLKGDFGRSFVFDVPALELILSRLPATLELAFMAMLIAVLVAIPLGLLAGFFPDSLAGRLIMAGSVLGFSLPTFWVGLMLILVFSVQLGWLPSSGRQPGEILGIRTSFASWDSFSHLILPALNLALFKMALVIRLVRAGVTEAVTLDYVRYAHAKGLGWPRVVGVHILKNIMIPVVTVLGLEFGSVVAFAVVTETIFAWPGTGKLIIDSINVLDRPVIVAYLMIIVLLFITTNFLVDLTYMLLDPRARAAAAGEA